MTFIRPVARSAAALALVTAAAIGLDGKAIAGDGSWSWPLAPSPSGVAARFDGPDTPYGPGHRGVDLPGLVGEDVRAVASGTVSFAGMVAGVPVVSINHGAERSTYQPVLASVDIGGRVSAGDVIGRLAASPSHCVGACLHLGRILNASGGYLDPLDRLGATNQVRLVDPDGPPPIPPTGPAGLGVLRRPVGGPVTSAFGMRTHPVTGKRKLHDGTDFGAACGTPVRAAADGVVIARGRAKGYGRRVVVRHSSDLETSYNHLSRIDVDVGDQVGPSTVVGRVGSTGLSTGCHLHFMVRQHGKAIDPSRLL